MKAPPRNPMARQALSIDLLCKGIREGRPYERLEALRAVTAKQPVSQGEVM